MNRSTSQWQFCIDRGGTFTDCIGYSPEGDLQVVKVLSSDNAPIDGIRKLLQLSNDQEIPDCIIQLGTTIGTNALLERTGSTFALLITKGFKDVLQIGTQQRPDIFQFNIQKPEVLYKTVVEIEERIAPDGTEITPLSPSQIKTQLTELKEQGYSNLAILFVHGYLFPEHEKIVADLASEVGFSQISCSHEVCPEIGLLGRGDTTSADAYLTPLLKAYLNHLSDNLPHAKFQLLKSNGGLASRAYFRGHHSLLSGPAGGVVACSQISEQTGINKIIGFDMGGTSTDVSRYDGSFDRVYETVIGGVRVKAPMMNIHTVAAGGGSLCKMVGGRLTVGPESAGSYPGPVCYGIEDQDGNPLATDLALTDINFFLGRIFENNFPFELKAEPVSHKIRQIQQSCKVQGYDFSESEIALGFLEVANMTMAQAIKEISVAKGHDIREYALCCYGGASGQHACAVANILDVETIVIPHLSGVLSAYGIGQADFIWEDSAPVADLVLSEENLTSLKSVFEQLKSQGIQVLTQQGVFEEDIRVVRKLELRFKGTLTTLTISQSLKEASVSDLCAAYKNEFFKAYEELYGYTHTGLDIEIVQCRLELIAPSYNEPRPCQSKQAGNVAFEPVFYRDILFQETTHRTPVYKSTDLPINETLSGPAVILDTTNTIIVEPEFKAHTDSRGHIVLKRKPSLSQQKPVYSTILNPVTLEIFHNLFMSVAEQMGHVLKRTSFSPNIKDRLDFSCAIFDQDGSLVSNAPHIPVHLGAMGETVKHLLNQDISIQPGDVFITNDPFGGGSHLPDITVITPVFLSSRAKDPTFFTVSRAHHADIGGSTPGSLPPFSTSIEVEGILIKVCKIVENHQFNTDLFNQLFVDSPSPARKPSDNLADLQAQIAANNFGIKQLIHLCETYGTHVVSSYMKHIQNNASVNVLAALNKLPTGTYEFEDFLDDETAIKVTIFLEQDSVAINFAGTGPTIHGNLNAPRGVAVSAVLYVLRTLISEKIPLNEGCLAPVILLIPDDCVINPYDGAAVVGGTVETSQRIVDVLCGALRVCAASQGTMNNLAFGNKQFGYYETLGGGAGAGADFHGADGVHTHMTNTRITDVEILESQYPIRLLEFSIRQDSGGRGQFNGGNGVVRKYQFLEELDVSILSERRVFAPYGLNGGQSGKKGENLRIRADGQTIPLRGKDSYHAEVNEILEIRTPGGGGWGTPQS